MGWKWSFMQFPDPTERLCLYKNTIRSMSCEPPDLPSPGQKSRTKYTRNSHSLIGGEKSRGKAMDSRLASVGVETSFCCSKIHHWKEPQDIPTSGSLRGLLTEVRMGITLQQTPRKFPAVGGSFRPWRWASVQASQHVCRIREMGEAGA